MRVFISIDLPRNIQKEIGKIQEKLPEFKGKKTEKENLHLTLKFLGDIDEETLRLVKEKLFEIRFKSFEAKISEIGAFDNLKSRKYNKQIIVWLKLTNCEQLQKAVDETLSNIFKKEERFMSHVTIARVKYIKNKKDFCEKLQKIEISKELAFEVKSFKLKRSILGQEGSVYETLEEYSLER
jgi:2'-5' RNA ligase